MHFGNFKEAVSDFDKSLRHAPNDASIYYQRGLALFELKDYHRVITDMDSAIQKSSIDRYEYYFLKAKALLFSFQTEKALAYFNKTLSLTPRFAEAYMYRAVTRKQLNDQFGACEDYTMAASLGYNTAHEDDLCD